MAETPQSITGGCLCGAIRYSITFPPNHSFEAQCITCQCSQCRRNTGSLLARFHGIPSSALTYTSPTSTLKTYRATPHCERGFCSDCGSFLFWRDDRRSSSSPTSAPEPSSDPDQDGQDGRISVAVGTFDKTHLRRWGRVLAVARTHLWCEDEVVGVTDRLQGVRWKRDCEGEGVERMD